MKSKNRLKLCILKFTYKNHSELKILKSITIYIKTLEYM